ncbi:PLP-dependent aminotransferase family protein [Pedobacter sp. L105]|uniref:aminotransferase-like domain-containing protein n=1 Tax=Pedobacter sp. L105 TaxID=1641871 RepID=UPI00131CD476|nr:PLP-dependent aminotransferase family protein [Pedobacter sp. L105]
MKEYRYQQVAEIIEQQIVKEILRTGDKLPSLRMICMENEVSLSTALKAYYTLESKFLIESRPKSGYFVSYAPKRLPGIPQKSNPLQSVKAEDIDELIGKVYHQNTTGHTALSLAIPAQDLLPGAKLNKELVLASRTLRGSGTAYEQVEGNERLRRQIARRSTAMGTQLGIQDIVITAGCVEAISYALRATTVRGDQLALESPVSFGMLQLAQDLGLHVVELPTDPQTGVDIQAFKKALETQQINACLLISNFSNPLGSCMPDEHKREIVRLIEKHQVPLIENDINGDVYFGQQRPTCCKSYDQSGLVLWCGSFSKTLAPGYRVGWIAAGKFTDKVIKMKRYHAIAGTSITQEAIAGFLETGRYDHHLRKLRQTLYSNSLQYARVIGDYFPEGTMASRPQGGSVLWVELPPNHNTLKLYEKAIQQNISIAPGSLFTLQKQFDNCMRLNYGVVYNDHVERILKKLGTLAKALG